MKCKYNAHKIIVKCIRIFYINQRSDPPSPSLLPLDGVYFDYLPHLKVLLPMNGQPILPGQVTRPEPRKGSISQAVKVKESSAQPLD